MRGSNALPSLPCVDIFDIVIFPISVKFVYFVINLFYI